MLFGTAGYNQDAWKQHQKFPSKINDFERGCTSKQYSEM